VLGEPALTRIHSGFFSVSAGYDATAKQKSQAKTARIPIKIVPAETLKKPEWIRVKAGSPSTHFCLAVAS
jgi:hypothetical protein